MPQTTTQRGDALVLATNATYSENFKTVGLWWSICRSVLHKHHFIRELDSPHRLSDDCLSYPFQSEEHAHSDQIGVVKLFSWFVSCQSTVLGLSWWPCRESHRKQRQADASEVLSVCFFWVPLSQRILFMKAASWYSNFPPKHVEE